MIKFTKFIREIASKSDKNTIIQSVMWKFEVQNM